MQVRNVNLKSRILAQCVGLLYLIVAIAMMGFHDSASAEELQITVRLETMINEHMGAEIRVMNDRLSRQLDTANSDRNVEDLLKEDHLLLAVGPLEQQRRKRVEAHVEE